MTVTKYDSIRTEAGLVVRDVVLAVEGDVHERGIELSAALFSKMASYFNNRLERGYIGSYVLLGHDGPRIGKITKLSQTSGNLIADILITNEQIASKVEQDDLTDLSITFSLDGVLADVSLLDNTLGQLSDRIPPLLVNVKEEFGIDKKELIQLSLKEMNKEQHMPLTEEDLQAIASLIDSKLNERLSDGSEDAGDVEMAIEAAAEKKIASKNAELEEMKRELEISTYVSALSNKTGSQYNEVTLRKIFDGIKSDEARKIKFESLMKQTDAQAKADIETHYSKPTVEKALRQEYQLKADNFKKLGITEDKYVRMNKHKAFDLK